MNGLTPSELRKLAVLRVLARVDWMTAKREAAAWLKAAPSRRVRREGALRTIKGMYAHQ